MLCSHFYIGYKPEKRLKTKQKWNISHNLNNAWPFGLEEEKGRNHQNSIIHFILFKTVNSRQSS